MEFKQGLTEENDPNGFDFGTFYFQDNGEPLQHFEVKVMCKLSIYFCYPISL